MDSRRAKGSVCVWKRTVGSRITGIGWGRVRRLYQPGNRRHIYSRIKGTELCVYN